MDKVWHLALISLKTLYHQIYSIFLPNTSVINNQLFKNLNIIEFISYFDETFKVFKRISNSVQKLQSSLYFSLYLIHYFCAKIYSLN
jgi:hypothetical protein